MLDVNQLGVRYGSVQALWDVSISVRPGEIVAVLGANGAGKSTLVDTVVGLQQPAAGTISFDGRRIDGQPPHLISGLGIAYGPEGGGLFRDMSVLENLELGAYHRTAWKVRHESLRRVHRLFPRLEERSAAMARTLSGGERQMLVIGRALMSLPRLCIFDEPSIGMSPLMVSEAFSVISRLREEDITVLIIEQNVRKTLEIADRGYVLQNGHVALEGRPDELRSSSLVGQAYLGLDIDDDPV